jgi:hypothetical protein
MCTEKLSIVWKRGRRSLFFNLDVMTLKEPLDKIGMLFNKPKSGNVQSFQPQTTHNVLWPQNGPQQT